MAKWEKYEMLDGRDKNNFRKKLKLYFLSIGCPLLSLILLCSYNIWNSQHIYNYNYSFIDNELYTSWNKEFGQYISDNYISVKKIQKNLSLTENYTNYIEKLPDPPQPSEEICAKVNENEKYDCFPRGVVTKDACQLRGCCYIPSRNGIPYCFYPPSYRTYSYTKINKTDKEIMAEMKANFNIPYPNIALNVLFHVFFVKNNQVKVQISDANESIDEYINIFSTFDRKDVDDSDRGEDLLYDVIIDPTSVGFQVIRKSTNVTIFDSRDIGGFIYSKQFIQISTKLPCKHIYGLGEGRTDMPLDTNWQTRTLWNHDNIPTDGVNGYGSYPMYMCAEGNSMAHMVVFENVHATDFILQPGGLTYRTIGPILNIDIFLGPTPLDAVQQVPLGLHYKYLMPPYWSLGFHLCRFGYKSVDDVKEIWNKTVAAGIPFDTQWVDIDYMKDRNDFTLDPKFNTLGNFVNMLHQTGMHFVPILDPGVSGSEPKGSYPPYDQGLQLDIFVKDYKGKKPIIGKVWNSKSTVFPDFTHPKVIIYWIELLKNFHKDVQFDGLWLDMNEPSNFVNGSLTGCPNNDLEQPPYVPGVHGGVLNYLTLCMSANHAVGPHYDYHNLYGLSQSAVASFVLSQIRGKRPFIISRSTTITSGVYGGHWTGDVMSTWEDMAQSVKDIIMMAMYGVNLVGADICGFNGNTSANLCKRWQQLGAFYPFSRNHNSDDAIAQDPVSLGIVDSTKNALLLRYSLLPYLYTLFWQARNDGLPVIRPLFYLFPDDDASYMVNTQFMWGDGLLISPVLQEGVTYVKAYLGKCVWYDIYTSEKMVSNSSDPFALAAPEDTIPVLIRAGTILVLQEPSQTTVDSRKNPFALKVALNETNQASGLLYWDDGETIGGPYSTIYFGVKNNTLMSCNDIIDYKFNLFINKIEIFSLNHVQNVTINDQAITFNYNSTNKVMTLKNLNLPMQKDFNITWHYNNYYK